MPNNKQLQNQALKIPQSSAVEGAPKVLKEAVSKAEADEIKAKIEEQGAVVTLK